MFEIGKLFNRFRRGKENPSKKQQQSIAPEIDIADIAAFNAQKYYQSAEYLQRAEELRELILGIRGLVAAIDFDGTLLSTEWERTIDESEYKRLKLPYKRKLPRPFSKEFLKAFSESDNQLVIWTGKQYEDFVRRDAKEVQLDIPDNIIIVTRAKYMGAVRETPEFQELKEKTYRLGQENKIQKKSYRKIDAGWIKIPHLLKPDGQNPVQVLICDYADSDRELLEILGATQEQLVAYWQIAEFRQRTAQEILGHHQDTALLEMARKLHARFHQRS